MANLVTKIIMSADEKTFTMQGSELSYGDTFDMELYNTGTATDTDMVLEIRRKGVKKAECIAFTDATGYFTGELDLGTVEMEGIMGDLTGRKTRRFTIIVRDTVEENTYVNGSINIISNPNASAAITNLPTSSFVTKVGTPVDDQVGVWTGDGTIEGTSDFTYDGANLQFTGDLGSTGTRITKGWFTDLQVTNAIAGDITGNAATVSVNANLTGVVTSVGNTTAIADKALAIAKLANGTPGELITWGATGVIETVSAGTVGYVLTANAGAAPTFQATGAGANIALDNLAGVAIATSLVAGTADTVSLGSTTKEWLSLYIGNAGKIYLGLGQDLSIERSAANTMTLTASTGILLSGPLGVTGTRVSKGWFTDLQVTNAIAGDITGNAGTVTTITGLAPDTATTQATQASITTCANLTTVGALNAGSITSGFGAINIGASDFTTTGAIGRDTDNELNWGVDDSFAIVIGGVTHNIVSISDGVGDNDKLATQGYVDDNSGAAPEGTAVLSTGEVGGIKFLREDGDNTCSWQAVPGGGDALTANPLSQFAATTSLQLKGVISDETGSGALVFATSPTLVTPALGTPASGVMTNVTGTAAGLTAGNVTTNANLTGVVTSVGNATAIADKALAIAKLADGTDGELITWDAAGVIATVAVGTSGQILTSNGAGSAPTFQAQAGGGDVSKVGTPVDNQVGVWTGDGTIEGTAGLTYDGSNLLLTGDIGITGTRITKGWFTDLQVTNAIAGSITGNAGTVTTITGLAPDTATTQATQGNITSAATLATVGTITSGTLSTGAVLADVTMTLGADADGDIYYRSSNKLTRLAKGTGLQQLRMNAGATAPEWAVGGGLSAIAEKTAAYTILDADNNTLIVLGRANGADRTFTLPTLADNLGNTYRVKNMSDYVLTVIGETVASDAVEAGTTTTNITATGHSAVVGHAFKMTSGDESGEVRRVTVIVDANNFTIDNALSGTPSSTETFDLYEAIEGVDVKQVGFGEQLNFYAANLTNDEWLVVNA